MYIFKDKAYTQAQLEEIADRKGYTFEELMLYNPEIQGLKDEDIVEKETAEATLSPASASANPTAGGTESKSEEVSLGTPWKPTKLTKDGEVDHDYYRSLGTFSDWQKYLLDATIDINDYEARDKEYKSYLNWQETSLADPGQMMLQQQREMNQKVLANSIEDLKIRSSINKQIDLSFSSLGEIQSEEEFFEDSKMITGDIINQDVVIKGLVNDVNKRIEKYNKTAIEAIQKEFDLDIKKLVSQIESKYDLSNADQIEAAEKELEQLYNARLVKANKAIEEAQAEGNKFQEDQINSLFSSKIYNGRVDYLNGIINEKIDPLWKQWQIDNAGGLASFYGFSNATDQLIAGMYDIGKNWEAAKASMSQLAISGVKKEVELLNQARSFAGFTDPNQQIYVYPDGVIDYEKSNLRRPATISQGSGATRQPRYTLSGEIDTKRYGAFGEVFSKPMTYKDYIAMQENKIEKFKDEVKINLEEIQEFDKLINLVEAPELFDEDGATVNDVIGVVFRMAPQLGASITGAALAPATGGSSLVASSMFMFANEYGSAYWQGVTQNLAEDLGRQPTNEEIMEAMVSDKYQNQAEAAGWATVSALLEQGTGIRGSAALKASKKSLLNFAKKLGYKDLKEFITKTNKNQILKVIKQNSKKIADRGFLAFQEGGVEVLQGVNQAAAVNAARGDAAFKDVNILEDFKEDFGGGVAATLAIPGFGKMMRMSRNSISYLSEQAYKVSIGKVKAEQRDKFFKDANNVLLQLRNNNKISEEQYQAESKRIANLKNKSKDIPKNYSFQATQQTLDLMLERDKLEAKIKNSDPALTGPDKERVKAINAELLEILVNEDNRIKSDITKQNIDKQMSQVLPAKGMKVPTDSRIIIVNEQNVDALAKQYGVAPEVILNPDEDTEGGYIAKEGVILMSETAAKDVIKHEGLHNYLDIALNKPGNENLVFGMAEILMEKMQNQNPEIYNALQKHLNSYRKDPKYSPAKVAEEVITYYGQLKDQGAFNANENKPLLQSFIDTIRNLLENLGFKNVEINEQNVDRIIDNYVNNIEGKGLTSAQRKIARGDVTVAPEIEARGETSVLRDPATQATVQETAQEPLAMAAAKKLNIETTNQINEDIKSLQQEIKENEEVAKRFNKEPEPTAKQRRLENKIKEDLSPTIEAFVESQTKRLYDPIPKNIIPEGVTRDYFKNTMRNDVESMVFSEYEVGKQDIEKFIVNRGYLRANSLAETLGIPGVEQGVAVNIDEQVDLAADDTTPKAEDKKPKPTKRGKLPREFPEIFDQDLKDDFETAAFEILESDIPDVDSKDFKSVVTDIFRGKLNESVKKKLGGGKNYEFAIKKLAPKMKEILPVQWFVRIEGQTKPENRLFTNPPVRLTKQEDIDAAKRRDDVYVENTAQGVNLYTFKDFDPKILADYLLAPPINPETGARSGLRGTRKTAVTEGVVDTMGEDVVPQTVKQIDRLKDQLGKISEKMRRDPDFLAAKKFKVQENIDKKVKQAGGKVVKPGKDGVDRIVEFFTEGDGLEIFSNFLFQDVGKQGKFQFLKSSVLSNAGNTLKRALGRGFPFIGNYDKGLESAVNNIMQRNPDMTKEQATVEAEKLMAETKKALEDGTLFETSELQDRVREALKGKEKRFKPDQIRKMNLAIDGQTSNKLNNNLNNIKDINEGKDLLLDLFREAYVKNPKNLDVLAFISYNQNSNTNPFRNLATVIGKELGILTKEQYEEHTLPFGEFANTLITSLASDDKIWQGFKNWAKDNYFQEVISKGDVKEGIFKTREIVDHPTRSLAKDGKTVLPDWASKSEMHPLLKQHIREAIAGKRDWSDVVSADIRKYNEYKSERGYVNPNTANRLGLTDAERYNVVVPKSLSQDPNVVYLQNQLIYEQLIGKIDAKKAKQSIDLYVKEQAKGQPSLATTQQKANVGNAVEVKESGVMVASKKMDMSTLLDKANNLDKALKVANAIDKPVRKIRIFDFDDTVARSNSLVFYTRPDGTQGQLTAEQFAKDGARLVDEGAVMDFSDFNIVRDGKKGPLFAVAEKIKEARGNEDLFILTARAPESQQAIYEFLKSEGLEFKMENIIGLGNSTAEAKANWVLDKAAEGYNDFYFADDAIKNVEAVKKVLQVVDVKSKIQQAKMQEAKGLNEEFNKLIEQTTGIGAEKVFSKAKAKILGERKGKWKFWIPPSAEDFTGLMYPLLAKGKAGEKQMEFIKKNLLDPWAKSMANLQQDRLNLMLDFRQLKKSLNVPKELRKQNETGFTNEQAVRVYLYTAMGNEVPGLSKRDTKDLNDIVSNDPKLKLFAEQILAITKGDGYISPKEDWLSGTITTDLIELLNTTKRQKYIADWQQNADAIFNENNLNKLEALYGANYREAVENMLQRMKTGRNRLVGGNRLSNRVLDYINGSIGTIMFFNTRSAILQSISAINYVNWSFNNPIKAGMAFANQPQYWKDFMYLMNSTYLKDRRNGQRINISEAEIRDAAKTSKNKAKAAMSYILSKGYLPTQFMDSFAIASGGATFYRNRINDLLKETDAEGNKVYNKQQAEEIALREWQEQAEENQQSSRVDKISQQQASDLGRVVLAFANTPMQYARLQKRAFQDLANGRGDAKSHISKIIYYGFVQNMLFNALQQAVFALGFGDDEEEKEARSEKYFDIANGMLDSTLRGLGVGGQAVSVSKNFLLDLYERSGRSRPEYVDSMWKLMQFSPPISSKISKLRQAAWQFDSKKRREKIFEGGFSLDNPAYLAFAKVVSATTNLPLDRVLQKFENIESALAEDNDFWQRVAMLAGWPEWQIKQPDKKKTTATKKKSRGGITIKKRKIKVK